jgi:Amt family ammonium transporter
MVTNTAAAAASLTWLFIGWLHKGAPSVVGAVSGAVAGLVAITTASGYVDVSGALAIGLAAGSICYGAILLRERLKVDDALDVWAVHGVGGTTGAILTGVFASTAINPAVGGRGLLESGGNTDLLVAQVIAVGATWIFSGAMTLAILKVVDLVFKVRVNQADELAGLDLSLHREVAYQQA